MSHLIAPTAFRAGRTFPWKNVNLVTDNPSDPIRSDLLSSRGSEQFLKYEFKRHRQIVLRTKFVPNVKHKGLEARVLYMPRMQQKPRRFLNKGLGREMLYGNVGAPGSIGWASMSGYIWARKFKNAPYTFKPRPQLNKWLATRLLRGTGSFVWHKSRKRSSYVSTKQYLQVTKDTQQSGWVRVRKFIPAKIVHSKSGRRQYTKRQAIYEKKLIKGFPRRKLLLAGVSSKGGNLKTTTLLRSSLAKGWASKKRYFGLSVRSFIRRAAMLKNAARIHEGFRSAKYLRRAPQWRERWRLGKPRVKAVKSQIRDRKLSRSLTNMLRKPVRVHSKNLFAYLVEKGLLTYRSHQEHFWNAAYRRYRFHYASYYDVVNSFLVVTLFRGAEHILLQIIRKAMPFVQKPRKYMYFLDSIIKHMPQIRSMYSVFRMTINGKLAGGTKRTKTFTIGYGRFPMQSLTLNASSSTSSYTHRFGEFGLNLLMCLSPSLTRVSNERKEIDRLKVKPRIGHKSNFRKA